MSGKSDNVPVTTAARTMAKAADALQAAADAAFDAWLAQQTAHVRGKTELEQVELWALS